MKFSIAAAAAAIAIATGGAMLASSAGADPDLADKNGVTPLAHARANGQEEIARMIEAAGGRTNQ